MRTLLWKAINRCWQPRGTRQSAESYVREYWREKILLDQIFEEKSFPLTIKHVWMRVVVATLPVERP